MIGHTDVTAVAASGDFWQASMMLHFLRRACLYVLLIVALTVGQVPMVGHAGSNSFDAAATMDVATPAAAHCNACDRMAGLDFGTACSLPCSNTGPVLPAVASPIKNWIGLRFVPVPWSRLPHGRTIPPEPDPPRAFA